MDRVVYIVSPEAAALACTVRLTKLMKWEKFSAADFSDLQSLFRATYASYLQPEDRSIILGLIQLQKRPGEPPLLDGDYGREVFNRMLASGRLFYAEGAHIRLKTADAEPVTLAWEALPDSHWRPTSTLRPGAEAFALNPPIYVDAQACTCGELQHPAPAGLLAQWLAAGRLDEAAATRFCLRLAKQFPEATFPVPPCVRLDDTGPAKPVALLTIESRSLLTARDLRSDWVDLRDRLRLRLRFRYGAGTVAWDASEPNVSHRDGDRIIRATRDRGHERSMIEQLRTWGFTVDDTGAEPGFFNFDSSLFRLDPPQTWRDLLTDTFNALPTALWQLDFAPGLEVAPADPASVYTDMEATDDHAYAFELGLRNAGHRYPLLPALHRALRSTGRKLRPADLAAWLADGDFALRVTPPAAPESTRLLALPPSLLQGLTEHVHELFDARPFASDGRARLGRWRIAELMAAGLVPPAPTGSTDESSSLSVLTRLSQRLGDGIAVQARPAPAGLQATLRSYQQHGLGWLHALASVSAGGILADDMGLGKTVQVIAHLLELQTDGALPHGALIVAPTSVIDNWETELARFAPALRVARYHGADRDTVWQSLAGQHITVTTYSLLWRDLERLASRPWDLVILDEAQFIKNASARTAHAARQLNAARRLCLTGTPVENHLQDVWSLFEFLLPGFLGDEATFRQRIAQPLADDPEAAFATILRDRLRRRLAPFVLRRRKEDVLPDLPPKTEVVHAVAMSPAQADRYAELRREARESIRAAVADQGLAGARMNILTQLLRLRQVCCDPRLAAPDFDPAAAAEAHGDADLADSAKLTALLDLLDELQERGSRTLVFSQFTSMLALISAALRAAGREHLLLTGDTRDRASIVQRFQSGACPLLLISLRAGGFGLNLTAADSVIHYDPWWNPATERQATDRSHRLGQTKPVFVYKLIIDDSIESRIQELQRTKLDLVRGLLNEGDVSHLSLDEDTLDYLLED